LRFFLWISGALAILLAGALFFLERRIRLRTRRVLADEPRRDRQAERVFDETRMRHSRTGFADQMPLRAPWAAGDAAVFCTAEALFVGELTIPLESVEDAFMAEGALRLRWRRGGELLETELQARASDLERLRREIHLRQKNVVEKLMTLVDPR